MSDIAGLTITPLAEADVPAAAQIIRLAFGTFLGAPDPANFWPDRDYAHGRFHAPHVAAFAAMRDGALAGSIFVTSWGSSGFFGPLTVHPDLQDSGIGKALVARATAQFDAWGTRHAGLFTFAHSARHVGLYQKFGYEARFLTAIMVAPARAGAAGGAADGWHAFSALAPAQRDTALAACRDVAETVLPGLDLTGEIGTTAAQKLGETVLLEGPGGLAGFAICHYGPRSEAGADTCFVKFAVIRAAPSAGADFVRLLDACARLAGNLGVSRVLAGVNLSRRGAYRAMLEQGFRTEFQGVAMHRNDDPGYCRPDAWVIDDWR
jgi:ribosomal protein S18 acetylase RimI-like enzyme